MRRLLECTLDEFIELQAKGSCTNLLDLGDYYAWKDDNNMWKASQIIDIVHGYGNSRREVGETFDIVIV